MILQTKDIFGFLFPGNAMLNALIATSYISILPSLLLYFVPKNINIKPNSLSMLVNFAGGSLLGDLFLHLLPHVFDNQGNIDRINVGNRNILVGVSIFLGVFIFYTTDKYMRTHFEEFNHDQIHSREVQETEENITLEEEHPKKRYNLRPRKENKRHDKQEEEEEEKVIKRRRRKIVHRVQIRPSTYSNILADFIHNMTDGMALAASFYISPTVGATTAIAVFFHEIPHEISDFIILLKGGFTKAGALKAQLTTVAGAYIGVFTGIVLQEIANHFEKSTTITSISSSSTNTTTTTTTTTLDNSSSSSLFGTAIRWSDVIISVIAGGFLYVATVRIIPEMLSTKPKGRAQTIKELSSMVLGLAVMVYISWSEQQQS